MIATLWHGESDSVYNVIDDTAPPEEQPAVVASVSLTDPDYDYMTLDQVKRESAAVEAFRWTDACYKNPVLHKQMEDRLFNLEWRKRSIEYAVEPLIKDDARRKAIKAMSRDQLLARYPNICAHLICESLGYATPTTAAYILGDALVGRPNYCEWIDACWKCNPTGPVRAAIKGRHRHRGFMAHYPNAKALVVEYNASKRQPVFASWF